MTLTFAWQIGANSQRPLHLPILCLLRKLSVGISPPLAFYKLSCQGLQTTLTRALSLLPIEHNRNSGSLHSLPGSAQISPAGPLRSLLLPPSSAPSLSCSTSQDDVGSQRGRRSAPPPQPVAPAAACFSPASRLPLPPPSLKRAPHACQELYKADRGRRGGQRCRAEPRSGAGASESLSERPGSKEEASGASGQDRRCSGAGAGAPQPAVMYRSTKGASKARRDQINAEIRNLKELLPLAEADKVRLSYLHIMSLACIYTRKGVFFAGGEQAWATRDYS